MHREIVMQVCCVCRGACYNYLSVSACGSSSPNLVDLYYFDDGSGHQIWQLTAVAGSNNTYDVTPGGRAACYNYLSSAACGSNVVDLYYEVSLMCRAPISRCIYAAELLLSSVQIVVYQHKRARKHVPAACLMHQVGICKTMHGLTLAGWVC